VLMDKISTPEILAPVGDWEMCLAAVHNGADAVYLGMPGFNARGRAKTFGLDELREIINYCHLYGVRVLLAFNVLIFQRELEDAARLLQEVLPLRPDALIVQDIGLVRLIKQMAPEQVVHASTQMTISNFESLEIVSELGIKRYVLARELSLEEIARIRAKTDAELEVFVHGALCVAYSGQCLTSESQGGRSANRGQCAQACRLPYDLIVDGKREELGARQYLLSPKDLCGLDEVPKLQELGINSFKIEGRLKAPEYVASTVRNYKAKRDGLPFVANDPVHEMKVTYAREYFSGWLHGVDHQRLVDGRYSDHHGDQVGTITAVNLPFVRVQSSSVLRAGDGLLCVDFEGAQEFGGKIHSVKAQRADEYEIAFLSTFPVSQLKSGMQVFVTGSDAIHKELHQSFTAREQLKRLPINIHLEGAANRALELHVRDADGHVVTVHSKSKLETALKAPLTEAFILEELSALGQTPFQVMNSTCQLEGALFLNHKEFKEMRREFVSKLIEARVQRPPLQMLPADEVCSIFVKSPCPHSSVRPKLSVLLRESSQISALDGIDVECVYLDYEFGKDYQESVAVLRRMGLKVGIATTRIMKPGELGHLKVIDRLRPDVVLIRNLGALQFFQKSDYELVADFSLNVTNSLTAEWLSKKRISRICPSYDLNREQLLEFCSAAGQTPLEVTIHQYMPTFHMEHCVYAAFLSKGSSYRDCGRPCEKHRVELRDSKGVLHPLKPDAECRNTVFQGKPQSASKLVPDLLKLGVAHYRLEALFETADNLREKIVAYHELLNGHIDSSSLYERLGVVERYGVTEGQLYNIRTWQDRKKESSP
jgi:putative protease